MRIPWRRVAVVAAVAVPIAAVVGVVWAATRDLSRYQARLTEQVRKVTGRELAARVPLAVRLGSEPAMVAEGVTLSNAPWGARPDMARVRRMFEQKAEAQLAALDAVAKPSATTV